MGDEFCRQYSTLLKCWKCVMCLECDAVLLQNLRHNLNKSEFHVQTNDLFSSIKFEITMSLNQFYWMIQNDCE
jgi:16S rRNA A1518/A1519 N6-dimethyltransferase RsmA/KsgA/DIM1 with predicted DNA glycosylase/AP lyase activity